MKPFSNCPHCDVALDSDGVCRVQIIKPSIGKQCPLMFIQELNNIRGHCYWFFTAKHYVAVQCDYPQTLIFVGRGTKPICKVNALIPWNYKNIAEMDDKIKLLVTFS